MAMSAQNPTIFNTIPLHNYLGLLGENTPKKIVNFLNLSTNEVSKAMGVSQKSVRYDEKMPRELAERLQEIAIICELVAGYFNGDVQKTTLWFQVKNPALGGISPRDMIRFGRYQKLEKFVQNALAGNVA
ncbi:MAG: hypothetical protein A3F13_09515 [Gammaproteobacteria bacterium RIFCSPHIGHO2_12_FULL_40_19]|nr:MAG: hypothetical protein A3F13_09515 [Gammaproteobacteria bacterium RIFCSPHIGHO2_12_FULL_40_19]